MKKQHIVLFAILFLIITSFNSCKKEDVPAVKTKTELLSQGSWKLKSATVNNTPYTLPACIQDNIYIFTATGNGSINESTDVCAGASAGITPFTWAFENSETSIQLSTPLFQGGFNTINLVSLTETELVVSFPYSPGPGVFLTIVATFQH